MSFEGDAFSASGSSLTPTSISLGGLQTELYDALYSGDYVLDFGNQNLPSSSDRMHSTIFGMGLESGTSLVDEHYQM